MSRKRRSPSRKRPTPLEGTGKYPNDDGVGAADDDRDSVLKLNRKSSMPDQRSFLTGALASQHAAEDIRDKL